MDKKTTYFKKQFKSVWKEAIADTEKEIKKANIVDGKIGYQNGSYEGIKDFYTKWHETWKEFLRQDSDFNKLDEELQCDIEDSDWIKKEFEKYF